MLPKSIIYDSKFRAYIKNFLITFRKIALNLLLTSLWSISSQYVSIFSFSVIFECAYSEKKLVVGSQPQTFEYIIYLKLNLEYFCLFAQTCTLFKIMFPTIYFLRRYCLTGWGLTQTQCIFLRVNTSNFVPCSRSKTCCCSQQRNRSSTQTYNIVFIINTFSFLCWLLLHVGVVAF